MTINQVAERLEISPSLVYGLIVAGKLRCRRHGLPGHRGVVRVTDEMLAEYLEAAEREAAKREACNPPAAVARLPVLKHIRPDPKPERKRRHHGR